jgi:hypothetical protein
VRNALCPISIALAVNILLAVPACTDRKMSELGGAADFPTVTYCDLTSKPEYYDQKVVRVRAIFDNSFEKSYLYDLVCKVGEPPKTAEPTPAETWVDFDPSFNLKSESEEAKKNRSIFGFGRVDITAIGRFQTSHGPVRFGHLGSCQHQLVIIRIEKAVQAAIH